MLAVGPVAILPSPVLAVIPTTITTNTSTSVGLITVNNTTTSSNTIIVTNGRGSLAGSTSSLANITVDDKTVLVWTKGSFGIAANETYQFNVPGGSVLNKVGYNTNGTLQGSTDDVTIAGRLTSNGRVFLLANGNISVTSTGGSNDINTSGGFYASTIQQENDFQFTTQGTLATTGSSLGSITIGSATPLAVTTGSVEAVAGSLVVAGANLTSGDLILRSVTSGTAVNLASSSLVNVASGNLTVITNNAAITQNNSNAVTVSNSAGTAVANLTSGTGAITLNGTSNNFNVLNVSANNSTVLVRDANAVTIAASSVGSSGSLEIAAGGAVATSAAVTGGTLIIGAGGDVTVANGSTPSTINATTTAGNVSLSTAGALTLGNVSTTGSGNISVTSTGSVTVNQTVTAPNAVTITGTSVSQTATSNIVGSNTVTNVTMNATAGSVTLGNSTVRAYNIVASGGSITQLGGTTMNSGNATASSFNAGANGSITLTNNNVLSNSLLTLTGGTVSLSSTQPITVASANTTGGLTISTLNSTSGGGAVTLGSGSGTASANINVGGALAVTTNNSTITDDDDLTIRVFGATTLTTVTGNTVATGNITLDSANGASGRGSASFGQLNISAGASDVDIRENQTINFGTVTANRVSANSISGSIIFGGAFTTTGNVTANANTGGISQTAPLTLTGSGVNHQFRSSNSSATVLDNPSNSFGPAGWSSGRMDFVNGGNNIVVANSNVRLGATTSATNNLTINTTSAGQSIVVLQNNTTTGISGNNIVLNAAGPITVQTTGAIRNLTLNTTDTSATSIVSGGGGNTTVNGTLTITSLGNVTLNGTAAAGLGSGLGMQITGNVVLSNVVGDTLIVNQRNLTLSGSSTQANVTAVAGFGPFANTWGLALGNLNVRSLTANVVNGEFSGGANPAAAGSSGNITQLANTRLHVENQARFVTFNGGNIVLGNAGNNFGRVEAYTGGAVGATTNHSGAVTVSEDGSLKIGNVITGGAVSLTSRFGSVIEDTAASSNLTVGGVLTVNATNGSVLLGGTTNGNTTSGTVASFNVTAPSGAVALRSDGSIVLGPTAANSLSVRSLDSISQSGPLNIFGATTFNATNSITITDSANNFGPLTLVSGNASSSIAVTEANTLNLRSVTMVTGATGNFTVTSVNGDIVDTGLGGVKVGGVVGGLGTGVVSLVATNGNIVIDDPTTDFTTSGGVHFNAKNVTLSVLGSGSPATPLYLGAANLTSVATGNLVATSALGNIANAGNLNVTGSAFFQTGAGNIVLNQTGNQFGSVRFVGNQVNIVEANDTVLLTGSSAIGTAVIRSGGNLTVNSTSGGSISFGSVASLESAGTIVLPKSIQAANTLSVNAPGTKDLSALSVSSDLSGRNPINIGTGTYIAPGQ